LNIAPYGRPKKVDEESVLELIAQAGQITQRDLQQKTGLKKTTLSIHIKKWDLIQELNSVIK
jgi:DNA-binding MarR family transcriptional regulator